jgi:hypothetical protein
MALSVLSDRRTLKFAVFNALALIKRRLIAPDGARRASDENGNSVEVFAFFACFGILNSQPRLISPTFTHPKITLSGSNAIRGTADALITTTSD